MDVGVRRRDVDVDELQDFTRPGTSAVGMPSPFFEKCRSARIMYSIASDELPQHAKSENTPLISSSLGSGFRLLNSTKGRQRCFSNSLTAFSTTDASGSVTSGSTLLVHACCTSRMSPQCSRRSESVCRACL